MNQTCHGNHTHAAPRSPTKRKRPAMPISGRPAPIPPDLPSAEGPTSPGMEKTHSPWFVAFGGPFKHKPSGSILRNTVSLGGHKHGTFLSPAILERVLCPQHLKRSCKNPRNCDSEVREPATHWWTYLNRAETYKPSLSKGQGGLKTTPSHAQHETCIPLRSFSLSHLAFPLIASFSFLKWSSSPNCSKLMRDCLHPWYATQPGNRTWHQQNTAELALRGFIWLSSCQGTRTSFFANNICPEQIDSAESPRRQGKNQEKISPNPTNLKKPIPKKPWLLPQSTEKNKPN